MDQQNIPSYARITEEIKKHLSNKKELLLKRTLLLLWPGLVLVAVFSFIGSVQQVRQLFSALPGVAMIISTAVALVFLYMVAVAHVLSIERYIWIDAYFDKINIEPEESLKMARNLFWSSIQIKLMLFLGYYLWSLIAYFVIVMVAIFNFNLSPYMFILIFFILTPVVIYFLFYYFKTKFRYVWFVFLDRFGKDDYSIRSVLREVHTLNQINKSESFKKSIVSSLGIDFARDMAVFATAKAVRSGLDRAGKPGKIAGDVSGSYIQEASVQFASLAKIVVNRMLYELAVKEVYGTNRVVNEKLYSENLRK